MREEPRRTSRVQRYLMFAHTGLYGAMWLVSLIGAAQTVNQGSGLPGGYIVFLLVWSLLYIVHIASFMAMNGRSQSSVGDRQSYRDGYRDAMREVMALQSEGRSENLRFDRVVLEDDGELFEQLQGEKAKRREIR